MRRSTSAAGQLVSVAWTIERHDQAVFTFWIGSPCARSKAASASCVICQHAQRGVQQRGPSARRAHVQVEVGARVVFLERTRVLSFATA